MSQLHDMYDESALAVDESALRRDDSAKGPEPEVISHWSGSDESIACNDESARYLE